MNTRSPTLSIRACALPAESQIIGLAENCNFSDAYEHLQQPLPENWSQQTAGQLWLHMLQQTPPWIDRLMAWRNQLVQLFGLKNLGHLQLPENTHCVQAGERLGIFSVYAIQPEEIILEDDDRHLRVRVSVFKQASGRVVVSTVVHTKNQLGRTYMWFVNPFHRQIARTLLKRLSVQAPIPEAAS